MSNLKISQMTSLQKKIQHFFSSFSYKILRFEISSRKFTFFNFHLKIDEKRKEFVNKNYIISMLPEEKHIQSEKF